MTQSHGITILIVMVVMASMIVNMLPSHQNLQWTLDRPLIVRITMMAIMLSHDDDDDGD